MTIPTVVKRLYLMQVATLSPMNVPIVCYLLQTNDGKNILIDSGLPGYFQLREVAHWETRLDVDHER